MSENKIGYHHQTREEMIREILQDNVPLLSDQDYSEDDEKNKEEHSNSNVVMDPQKVMSSILSVSFNDNPSVSFHSEGVVNGESEDNNSERLSSTGGGRGGGGGRKEELSTNFSHQTIMAKGDLLSESRRSVVAVDSSNLGISLESETSSSSSSHQVSMSSQPEISQDENAPDPHSTLSTSQEPPLQNKNQQRSGSNKQATGMSVRCHCNLASCVTNNYMCKSERRVGEDGKELEAGCFVQELENESSTAQSQPMWNGRVATARRGCIEMLSREKQEKCSDRAGDQVHCCTQDMCNYPKSFYPSPLHNLNSNNRPTFDSSSSSASGIRGIAGMTPNLDHQVWLRAAVIAVPICGLMILVVLIVVARRLLQSDDYKDGRPHRRKNSSSALAHHTYHPPPFHPPTIVHAGQRSPYVQDGFHVKPVYMETSEYLLPPSYNNCTSCHQPHGTSQPRSSSASTASSYSHENGRKNSNNSETEQLVHNNSHSNQCHCADPHPLLVDEAGDGPHHTRSFSWNSIQPPTILSGSSPELPAVHRHPDENQGQAPNRKLNFLSKLGLSRSTQSESNGPLNTRPYNV